jgi:hypothetical protein
MINQPLPNSNKEAGITVKELSALEAEQGLRFLRNVTATLERSLQKGRPPASTRATAASSRNKRRTSRQQSPLSAD